MTFRLDAGVAETVAGHHESAASTIDDSAGSAPGAVDGGLATAYLAEILQAVCTSAAEIAAVNLGTAALVRDVADEAGLTDAAIGEGFTTMSGLLP
jgi:hypothetical protein